MQFECKECGESFGSRRSLHAHIKKHKLTLGDYYVKYMPRFDKLTNKPIEFKNADQYLSSDFNRHGNMIRWCAEAPEDEVKEYVLEKFKKRIEDKGLDKAPSSVYLKTAGLPTMEIIKRVFGSYTLFCRELGIETRYGDNLCEEFFEDYSDATIWVDTRENQPLEFKNSFVCKLDYGDYTLEPKSYTFTHVERKSFSDFASTVTNGYDRFYKEMERCRHSGCYLFVVIDTDFEGIFKLNNSVYKRFNMSYVFNKMRQFEVEFGDCCQFVFSGSRKRSEELIPKILCLGKKLWKVDLQYFWEKELNKNGLARRKSEAEQEVQEYQRRGFAKRRLYGRRRG